MNWEYKVLMKLDRLMIGKNKLLYGLNRKRKKDTVKDAENERKGSLREL